METTVRKLMEDRNWKWFPVVLVVTLLHVTILVVLWSMLAGLSPYSSERWTCLNNFDDNSSTLSNNETFSLPTNNMNASKAVPNELGVLLYGPKILNDRWCEDLNVGKYPLVDWSCDDDQKMMKYSGKYPMDAKNNSSETTTTEMELEMEGLPDKIDSLCANIQYIPVVHKIPLVIFVFQIIWGCFLVVVSKIEFDGMIKFLQFMGLLKLFFILINVITHIESSRYKTALLILLIFDICLYVFFVKNLLGQTLQKAEDAAMELETREMAAKIEEATKPEEAAKTEEAV